MLHTPVADPRKRGSAMPARSGGQRVGQSAPEPARGEVRHAFATSRTPTGLRPSQAGLAPRRCSCGGTPGPTGECAACRAKRLAALDHRPSAPEGRAPLSAQPGSPDSLELPLDGQPLDPDVDLLEDWTVGADPSGIPLQAGPANTSCCRWSSFEKSGDSYVDTATDSRKNIKFTYTVNFVEAASDPQKCVLVNWVQGTAKNKDGTYRRARVYDKTVDVNFPTMQIDSVDTDPVYWSNSTARWNYRKEGTGYYATDSPGPTTWADGMDFNLTFKMCLYCIDDVSATSDVTGSGVKNPLKCINWEFKAKYDATTGTFTH